MDDRILYVVNSGYGNMIMTTPTIRALYLMGYQVDVAIMSHYPDAHQIFKNHTVHGILKYHPSLFEHYDIAIKSLFVRKKAPLAIGPEDLDWYEYSEQYINLTVAHKFGYKLDWVPDAFFGEITWQGCDTDIIYIGNPTAQLPRFKARMYPHIYTLMDLLKENGYRPIQIGSSADAEKWDKSYEYVIPEDIEQCARVLAGGLAYIGQDCGISHIAGAINLPTFVLFGPTSFVKNGPAGNCTHVIYVDEYSCMPCQNEKKFQTCSAPCMHDLTPDYVLEYVKGVLR